MKIENFVLTSMNSGKILIVTSSLHRIEKFLEEEWLEGEPENFKKFKETKEKLDVDVVRAIELVGFTYDISVQRFDDEMEINLGHGIQYDFKKIAKKEFDTELSDELLEECSYDFCNYEETINIIDDTIREILKERI
jgi:hypothetical protein